MEFLIHLFGFVVIGVGLSFSDIHHKGWQYWVVIAGVSIVYLNAKL